MKLRWFSVAELDLSEAVDYYLNNQQSPAAAAHFAEEVDKALLSIQRSPYTYPIFDDEVRIKLIRRFPYSLLYFIEDNEIVVHSIIHQERKPGYWMNRA